MLDWSPFTNATELPDGAPRLPSLVQEAAHAAILGGRRNGMPEPGGYRHGARDAAHEARQQALIGAVLARQAARRAGVSR